MLLGPTGTINADPLFIDSAADYHLQPASPCKNTGDPAILNPGGARSDMGAYGGPGAANPIGTYTVSDDAATLYIKEDVIGTY
jgi:hypothetical protein